MTRLLKFLNQGFVQYSVTIALLVLGHIGTLNAQEASLDGSLLTIPVVVVGDTIYRVELTVQPGTDPVEFGLRDARVISDVSTRGATTLSGIVLSIPSVIVDGVSYWYDLALLSDNPVILKLQDSGINASSGRDLALELFELNVAEDILQARCIICHVEGGINSSFLFQRSNSSSTLNNFAVYESFLQDGEFDAAYILLKASGGDGHEGGVQLPAGGVTYNNMEAFLSALSGANNSVEPLSAVDDLFSGVASQTNAATLRRASVILAGRLPSDAEIQEVEAGDDQVLRESLRELMQGEGFHRFLLDGANDRLLVRNLNSVASLLDCPTSETCFPNDRNRYVDLSLADIANDYVGDGFDKAFYLHQSDEGIMESPLELVAHVVEQDLPYSEILTADYVMLSPVSNFAVGGTAEFTDPEDTKEFQPGQIKGYYQPGPTTITEEVIPGILIRVLEPGELQTDIPNAGVLTSIPFLFRYPTTATNRNRARARWTLLHFLDFDIERSAPRTIDPVALADKNNPTLFNENCAVCHINMDPVAGAFQNFDEEGFYRSRFGSPDSLDDAYIESGLYQHGDSWYRDMRSPGFFGTDAPSNDNSVQWLAQQIVNEPGFGRATVKF
jgi:hypothetical protein